MAATILSDKMQHEHQKQSLYPPESSSPDSVLSSASSTPLMTPSFQPNASPLDMNEQVPRLVTLLKKPIANPKDVLDELDLPDLDLSQNISALLKVGTSRAHVEAENSEGAAALIKGELGLEEYIKWLAILWRVYDALELGLSEHSSNTVLEPTYDPSVLARAESLSRDISYLLTLLPSDTSSVPTTNLPDGQLPPFPLPSFLSPVFSSPPAALTTYLDHLRSLASSSETAPGLLAHSYVRYLGDLSGGQFISARIKRAYNLDGLDGLRFYHFDLQNRVSSNDEDSRADGRRRAGEVKDWFRKGMDEGVGEDEDLKAFLIREANLAFALNTYLFSVIQISGSKSSPAITTVTAPPPLTAAQKIAQMTHPDGTPLRYYEKRELLRQEEERQRKSNPEYAAANAKVWRERIETFCLLSGTMFLGWVVSQYGAPYIQDFVGNVSTKFGLAKGEL